MTSFALHRCPLVWLVAVAAVLAGHGVARAQTNDSTDLSIELVELFAAKLQKKLDYMYFPQATGFVRVTLGSHRCDVIMGFPQGDDLAQGTNPYYRTAYALISKQGS